MMFKGLYFIVLALPRFAQVTGLVDNIMYKKCLLPPYPKHGTYSSKKQPNASPGDSFMGIIEITVSCKPKYVVNKSPNVKCFRGLWSGPMPRCVLSSDSNTKADKAVGSSRCILPHYPAHGTFTIKNEMYAVPGEAYDSLVINVTCQEGYVVDRPQPVICSNGHWSGEIPQCLSRCRLKKHPSLKYRCWNPAERDDMIFKRDCSEYEPEGTMAKPECQTYYQSATTLAYMKCSNGEWTNYAQKCIPQCGTLVSQTQLIANGVKAKIGEVPWHSAIYRTTLKPYELICGGSLITTKIVISAAHCFWDDEELYPTSDFVVAFGKLYRDFSSTKDESQSSDVKAIHVTEYFKGPATNFQDDIAIIELSKVIQYRDHIRPVCIDFNRQFENRQLQPGNKGKVAGWGLITESGKSPQRLRTVELPYVPISTCYQKVPQDFISSITKDKICAGYENAGTSVCQGDSGGGLAFPELDRGVFRYYLRGIVSTAPQNENACNIDTFTTFTRLTEYEAFINQFWKD